MKIFLLRTMLLAQIILASSYSYAREVWVKVDGEIMEINTDLFKSPLAKDSMLATLFSDESKFDRDKGTHEKPFQLEIEQKSFQHIRNILRGGHTSFKDYAEADMTSLEAKRLLFNSDFFDAFDRSFEELDRRFYIYKKIAVSMSGSAHTGILCPDHNGKNCWNPAHYSPLPKEITHRKMKALLHSLKLKQANQGWEFVKRVRHECEFDCDPFGKVRDSQSDCLFGSSQTDYEELAGCTHVTYRGSLQGYVYYTFIFKKLKDTAATP